MSILSWFTKPWNWLKHTFVHIKKDADKVAIVITQDINAALVSGVPDEIIKALYPDVHGVPQEILQGLHDVIPRLLAAELSLDELPANPSPEDLKAFADKILTVFNGKADVSKQKVYVNLAAEIYGWIQGALGDDGKVSFAEWVVITQKAYNAWKVAIAGNPGTSMLPGGTAFTETVGARPPYNPLDGVKITQE